MINDAIMLGPFTIKNGWIILAFSFLCSYIVMEFIGKYFPDIKARFFGLLLNGIFVFLVIYKFSILVIRPSIIVTNPMGILFFTGGTTGIYMGIALGVIYLFYQVKKNAFNNIHVLIVMTAGVTTAFISYLMLIRLLF